MALTHREIAARWYKRNHVKAAAAAARWRQRHPDKVAELLIWGRNYGRAKRLERKTNVLTHYGNGKCACTKCGFTDIRALSIDHISGGGNKERRETLRYSQELYRWLEKNNYPEGYQTLCMNCQWIKRYERKETEGTRIYKRRYP